MWNETDWFAVFNIETVSYTLFDNVMQLQKRVLNILDLQMSIRMVFITMLNFN